jgi:serine/threonine-protein kinase
MATPWEWRWFASAVAIGPDNSIYVTDPGNSRVLRGKSRIEGIDNPTGIAVDSSGTVYVSDGRNGHVWRIPAGGFASVFAGSRVR